MVSLLRLSAVACTLVIVCQTNPRANPCINAHQPIQSIVSEYDSIANAKGKNVVLLAKLKNGDLLSVKSQAPDEFDVFYEAIVRGNTLLFIRETIPYESGDTQEIRTHYFSNKGMLIAYKNELSSFDNQCLKDAVIRRVNTVFYNSDGKIAQRKYHTRDENDRIIKCEFYTKMESKRPVVAVYKTSSQVTHLKKFFSLRMSR